MALPAHPHGIYTVCQDKKDADAVAFAFVDEKNDPIIYPFKFPALLPTDVRIKILHTGLCQSDCLHARRKWDPTTKYPMVPGHEIIGEITMIGDKVTTMKVGDLVGVTPQRYFCQQCDKCKEGNNNLCDQRMWLYDPYFGGYATHIQLFEKCVFHIPKNLDITKAPPLLCAGVTVFAPIKRFAKAHQKCAVIGIGGLGHLAVQYAAKLGMEVTAFTTSMNREKEMNELGAAYLSSSIDKASLQKQSGKYDLVINTLFVEDADVFSLHVQLTRKQGAYIQVGAPPSNVPFKIDPGYILGNEITVAGSAIGNCEEVNDMLRFSADYNVLPICEHYKFEEFPKAFAQLEKGRPRFRCVVNVTDWAKQNGFDK